MSTHELDLYDHVAYTAASISEKLFTEPDDDWTPVLFMEDADGQRMTMPIEQFMVNEQTKDLLANFIIPEVIGKFSATIAVMVLSVWRGSPIPKGVDPDDRPRPSEDVNRTEAVMIIEYTAAGVTRSSMATIVRHEDSPPTLDEWQDDFGQSEDGRFVTPIVRAMKKVRP